MSTVSTERLLTAEEFRRLPDNGGLTELVRGMIVAMNMPAPRHGQVCAKVVRLVGNFVDGHDLGHLVCNDSGVITERDPDTVRGADVAFYSYARVPRGPFPGGYLAVVPDVVCNDSGVIKANEPNTVRGPYLSVVPEIVFEVRSPDDRWTKILSKVAEYLEAGVNVVCVLDPEPQTIHVYHADQPSRILEAADELTLPEVLGEFRVPVRRFFE